MLPDSGSKRIRYFFGAATADASSKIAFESKQPTGARMTTETDTFDIWWQREFGYPFAPDGSYEVARAAWDARETELADLRQEAARMRAVTGPPCSKCGRFLKAEHNLVVLGFSRNIDRDYFQNCEGACCVSAKEVLANFPDIAAQMGLTE